MLTGEIRSQIDRVWDAFWTGGISNPLEVIEQLTYLLFIKRLDELHTVREKQANRLNQPIKDPIFSPDQQAYRWSNFKNREARQMYALIVDDIFPFMKEMGSETSAFTKHMKDARFTLPPEKAGLLARVVDMLDRIPMEGRDTKGDLYEYMLSKLSSAGQNGQFRTPRHIIKLMVEMVQPKPQDIICDPACGTAGFLVAADEYLRSRHPEIFTDLIHRAHYQSAMFNGFDFDSTMLRIAAMNLMLHGIEHPNIHNRDSLAEDHSDAAEAYTLVLANPPFAGSLDYEAVAKDLLDVVKTKKTELLFLALFLRLLKPGGRAAVIVPDGVLFGSSRAHQALRRMLVEEQKLNAVISMPSGVFKPYAGVSTAVLFFTRTDSGGTDNVWFYDMQADGYSLDDKRTPLTSRNRVFDKNPVSNGTQNPVSNGTQNPVSNTPQNPVSTDNNPHPLQTETGFLKNEHHLNNIPDILNRYHNLPAEKDRPRTAQSFLVPKKEIAANDYDLSINRYKEIVYEEIQYDPPLVILDELAQLETEIQQGMVELREMLS